MTRVFLALLLVVSLQASAGVVPVEVEVRAEDPIGRTVAEQLRFYVSASRVLRPAIGNERRLVVLFHSIFTSRFDEASYAVVWIGRTEKDSFYLNSTVGHVGELMFDQCALRVLRDTEQVAREIEASFPLAAREG